LLDGEVGVPHFSNLERHDPGNLCDWARKSPDLVEQK
jgi:hypothetical protein